MNKGYSMSELVRPFLPQDGGEYYLIQGSIREDDFAILCQRKTEQECIDFQRTLPIGHYAIIKYVCGIGSFDSAIFERNRAGVA